MEYKFTQRPKSKLCSLPWTGFSNDPAGVVRPCCIYKETIKDEDGEPFYIQSSSVREIFHSTYMKKLRQDFRDGRKPIGCATCWIDEKNGKPSKREIYYRDNIDYDKEPDLPSEFQLIISNTCNLKCRSCSPSHSTKWIAEAIDAHIYEKPPHDDITSETSVFWRDRDEWMAGITELEIVGGEPFFIREWEILWKEFAIRGLAKKIRLGISTNATVFNGPLVEFLVENFRYTGIGLSLDGIGRQFEYLRHPGKWHDAERIGNLYHEILLREIDRERTETVPPRYRNTITHTISWMNLFYVPTFAKYVKELWPEFRIWFNVVHGPAHFSPWVLPEHVKVLITSHIQKMAGDDYNEDIEGILNFMNSRPHDPLLWRKGLATLKRGDLYRRENFDASFPEMAEVLKINWNSIDPEDAKR